MGLVNYFGFPKMPSLIKRTSTSFSSGIRALKSTYPDIFCDPSVFGTTAG